MTEDTTTQSVLFLELLRRPVVVRLDQRHGSSDGGAILLKACDERLGLTVWLAACISDGRQAGKVEHPSATWSGNDCSGSPAATSTAKIRHGWRRTRSRSCCLGATR